MFKQIFAVILFSLMSFTAWAAPVNINTADANTIAKSLKRIGPEKAKAIVEYREQHGKFQSLADLTKVHGIGVRTVEMNADDIKLDDK